MILGWLGVLLAVLDLLTAFPAARKWTRATSSTSSHPPSQPCCSATNSRPAGTSPHVPKRVSRGLALYFAYISYSPSFGALPNFRVSSAQSLKRASIEESIHRRRVSGAAFFQPAGFERPRITQEVSSDLARA